MRVVLALTVIVILSGCNTTSVYYQGHNNPYASKPMPEYQATLQTDYETFMHTLKYGSKEDIDSWLKYIYKQTKDSRPYASIPREELIQISATHLKNQVDVYGLEPGIIERDKTRANLESNYQELKDYEQQQTNDFFTTLLGVAAIAAASYYANDGYYYHHGYGYPYGYYRGSSFTTYSDGTSGFTTYNPYSGASFTTFSDGTSSFTTY